MPDHIHDKRIVRRQRHVRPARYFTDRLWVAAGNRDLKSLGVPVAQAAKDDSVALLVPAHEVPHHAYVSKLPRAGAIGIHDPDFGPPALIGIIGNQFSIRGIKRIHVDRRRYRQRFYGSGRNVD